MSNRLFALMAQFSLILLTMGTSCVAKGPYFAVKRDIVCPSPEKQLPITGGSKDLQFELGWLNPYSCETASVYIVTKPKLQTGFYTFITRNNDRCQLFIAFKTSERGLQSTPRLSDTDVEGAFLKSKTAALQISGLMGLELIGEATFSQGTSDDETLPQFCKSQSH